MPKFIRDKKVEKLARRVLKKYPEEFGFIDPADVYAVRDVFAMKHKKIATIGPINPAYQPFFPQVGALLITIRQCNWLKLTKEARILVIYHEFLHILQETREKRVAEGYRYLTVSHDMEDFYAIVSTFGARWLVRKDLPNILKKKAKIKRPETEYPQL